MSKTPEQIMLTMVRGEIAALPEDQQAKIKVARAEFEEVLRKHENLEAGIGYMAFALFGAEQAAAA